jgi:hypothetical protein
LLSKNSTVCGTKSKSGNTKNKDVWRQLTVGGPPAAAPEGARSGGGLLPTPPVVAEALRLRAPAAERILLEAVRVLEAEPVPFLPLEHRGRDIAATAAGEVSGRRQLRTKNNPRSEDRGRRSERHHTEPSPVRTHTDTWAFHSQL